MSDLEILERVINTLDNIDVPTRYTEQIAIPVANSSNLLKALYKAVRETAEKKAAEEAEAAQTEPMVEQEPAPEEATEN